MVLSNVLGVETHFGSVETHFGVLTSVLWATGVVGDSLACLSEAKSMDLLRANYHEGIFRKILLERIDKLTALLDSTGGGPWPFSGGEVICLVTSFHDRDLSLLNRAQYGSYLTASYKDIVCFTQLILCGPTCVDCTYSFALDSK